MMHVQFSIVCCGMGTEETLGKMCSELHVAQLLPSPPLPQAQVLSQYQVGYPTAAGMTPLYPYAAYYFR